LEKACESSFSARQQVANNRTNGKSVKLEEREWGERGKALTALSSSSCFLGFSLRLSAVFVIYTKQNGKGKQYTIDLNIRMFVCTWVYIFGLLQKRATMTSMRCNNNKHEKGQQLESTQTKNYVPTDGIEHYLSLFLSLFLRLLLIDTKFPTRVYL